MGGTQRATPPRDAKGDVRRAAPATGTSTGTAPEAWTPPSTHTTQALKRDPHPCAQGATGLRAQRAPRPSTVPMGAWTRSSSSSTFSSVTCHQGRAPQQPPSPIFGYDEPGDRHVAPGRDLADGEEAHWDPRAARGGGRSSCWDPQHRHPSPGAHTAPVGPRSGGLRLGIWHSPRAAGSCGPLEDVDLVPLDAVQVIVQRQQHLRGEGSGAA